MADVSKLSIEYLVGLFILYIVIHTGIGIWLKWLKKKEALGELLGDYVLQFKIANFLMKWFPAIYVVILLVML